MAGEKGPIPLAKNIHGNTQQTNPDLNAGNNDEYLPDASGEDPGKREIGEDEREHVFKDQQAGKRFNGNLSVSIDNVEGRSHSSHNHAHNNKGQEDGRNQPPIFFHIMRSDPEPIQPDGAEDEHGNDEEYPE